MKQLINVGLYGDGSRDSRRRAEYIYCDKAESCSACAKGKCFCVTTLFGVTCDYGSVERRDGGTKRSKAFSRVTSDAKKCDKYSALSYPRYEYITRIENMALLTLPYVIVEKTEDGLKCSAPGFGRSKLLIDSSALTPNAIMAICSYTPWALMGGIISDYQSKIVPLFLHQLAELFPEEYKNFIDTYPDYDLPLPDWKGRWAKLSTCNREESYSDSNGNLFFFDGEYMVCNNYRSVFTPFGAKDVQMRVKVTDDMSVRITKNQQVVDTTVFE